MKKIMNWVGIVALVVLIFQSTIGIINYASGSTPQGFPNGSNRMMMGFNEENESRAMPPQNNNTNMEGAPETNVENSIPAPQQNGEIMPGARMNFGEQTLSSSSSLRNLENGVPGFVMNCLALGLGIAWIVLFLLTRKQQKSSNLEI